MNIKDVWYYQYNYHHLILVWYWDFFGNLLHLGVFKLRTKLLWEGGCLVIMGGCLNNKGGCLCIIDHIKS